MAFPDGAVRAPSERVGCVASVLSSDGTARARMLGSLGAVPLGAVRRYQQQRKARLTFQCSLAWSGRPLAMPIFVAIRGEGGRRSKRSRIDVCVEVGHPVSGRGEEEDPYPLPQLPMRTILGIHASDQQRGIAQDCPWSTGLE